MTIQQQREMLLEEARSWIKTPHVHQGRVKGAYDSDTPGGVDCLMLFGECFSRTGLIKPLPPIQYSHDGHLHKSEELVLRWLEKYAYRISKGMVLPADLVVYKFGRRYSHGAIVVDPGWPKIIHAVLNRCVEWGNGDSVTSGGHHPSAMMFWRFNGWRE